MTQLWKLLRRSVEPLRRKALPAVMHSDWVLGCWLWNCPQWGPVQLLCPPFPRRWCVRCR